MADDPSDQLNTGLLFFIPYRAMEDAVFERLWQTGFSDMTVARGRVFQRLDADGTRLTDLAQRAQLTKQATAGLVVELERAGYVVRKPDPTDARARLIHVAERGAAAASVAAGAVAEVEADWTRHLGARQMGQLRRILGQLRELTDPYASSPPRDRARVSRAV